MTTGKVNRLFQLFLGSGLRYRVDWDGNRIVAITVFGDPDLMIMASRMRPIPSEGQLAAIRDVLGTEELAEEETVCLVHFGCTGLILRSVRYTARRDEPHS